MFDWRSMGVVIGVCVCVLEMRLCTRVCMCALGSVYTIPVGSEWLALSQGERRERGDGN